MAGKIYIVATPIGNLADITYRAVHILKKVDLILAEDTRVTKKLLSYYKIENLVKSYHHHSTVKTKNEIIKALTESKDIALVTDAGTPGISDPGNELISYICQHLLQVRVIPVPGPSAVTAALSVSGMNTSRFLFLGFMPKKRKTKYLRLIAESKFPVIFFESPYRAVKTLEKLAEELGADRQVMVGRELTKLHETVYRGTLGQVLGQMDKDKIKGEVVVVVSPEGVEPSSRV